MEECHARLVGVALVGAAYELRIWWNNGPRSVKPVRASGVTTEFRPARSCRRSRAGMVSHDGAGVQWIGAHHIGQHDDKDELDVAMAAVGSSGRWRSQASAPKGHAQGVGTQLSYVYRCVAETFGRPYVADCAYHLNLGFLRPFGPPAPAVRSRRCEDVPTPVGGIKVRVRKIVSAVALHLVGACAGSAATACRTAGHGCRSASASKQLHPGAADGARWHAACPGGDRRGVLRLVHCRQRRC